MKYPKKIMGKKELIGMGFPESLLLRASREKDQTFAFRSNPLNPTSPLLFDTEGFEKWRLKQVAIYKQSMQGGMKHVV